MNCDIKYSGNNGMPVENSSKEDRAAVINLFPVDPKNMLFFVICSYLYFHCREKRLL